MMAEWLAPAALQQEGTGFYPRFEPSVQSFHVVLVWVFFGCSTFLPETKEHVQ